MTPYGIFRSDRHAYTVRYPQDETWAEVDEVYEANITGVIGMLDKSDVISGWAKREVAAAAVRNVGVVSQMVSLTPVDEATLARHPAVTYLKSIPGYQRDAAANAGSAFHAIAEALAKGERPDVPGDGIVRDLATQFFRGFIEKHRPEFHPDYIEYMVASVTHEYAGTMDTACRIGRDVWALDYKTSSKVIDPRPRGFPYPETALQLAAGRWADFAGKPNDPRRYPIPPATRYGVVAVTPNACELIEYRVTPREFETFLALREVWGWVKQRKEEVKTGIVPALVTGEAA